MESGNIWRVKGWEFFRIDGKDEFINIKVYCILSRIFFNVVELKNFKEKENSKSIYREERGYL